MTGNKKAKWIPILVGIFVLVLIVVGVIKMYSHSPIWSEKTDKSSSFALQMQNTICEDAWEKDSRSVGDRRKMHIDYFDVHLGESCFGELQQPPEDWLSWNKQFVGETGKPVQSDDYVVVIFRGDSRLFGPYRPNELPDFGSMPRGWRLRGKGVLRYYRTDK